MAVDKLIKSLKNKIILAYSNFVKKLQHGYPMDGYEPIAEAISAVEFLSTFDVDYSVKVKILEYYILNLRNAK